MSGIRSRKLLVMLSGGAVGVLTLASTAWACTYAPRFVSLGDQAGPRGSTVTVTGQGVTPGSGVALRWDGAKGLQLAAATADDTGSFTAVATVPDVAPNVYSLVVVANDGISRAAFEVTTDAPLSASSDRPVKSSAWDPGAQPTSFAAPNLSQPAGSSASSNFGVGTALLGVGMAGLASAAGVAAVRRRRASSIR